MRHESGCADNVGGFCDCEKIRAVRRKRKGIAMCAYCEPCHSSHCDCGPCADPKCPTCPPRMCSWHVAARFVDGQSLGYLDSENCRLCKTTDPLCQDCGEKLIGPEYPCTPCYDRKSEGAGGDS